MNWTIDPQHTSATFVVRHIMISKVRGEFQKVSGKVAYDPDNLDATKVEVELDASSINTREPQRDTQLKSADFLDVEKFPKITFASRAVRAAGAGKLKIVGDLTIRGTTSEVTLDVDGPTLPHEDPWGNMRVGATATTTIQRSDFNMVWNTALEAGGFLVGDNVVITLDVSLIQDK